MPTKTKHAVVAAFLSLIEREDFDKITVTDLVEICDISRQTFYYHFEDIDEMLQWAFDVETEKICTAHETENWTDYSEDYIIFFTKYDTLMRKALNSNAFILIYNLILKSFSDCLSSYFLTKKGEDFASSKSAEFLTEFLSGAFTSMIVKEFQKPTSNYREVFSALSTALNGYALQ